MKLQAKAFVRFSSQEPGTVNLRGICSTAHGFFPFFKAFTGDAKLVQKPLVPLT